MGQSYPAGAKFGLLYGSANRDPCSLTMRISFELIGPPAAFVHSAGARTFASAIIYRVDMEVIFKTLLERVRRIELLQEPTIGPGLRAVDSSN